MLLCDIRIQDIESFNQEFKRQSLIPGNEYDKLIDIVNDLSKHTYKDQKHFTKIIIENPDIIVKGHIWLKLCKIYIFNKI